MSLSSTPVLLLDRDRCLRNLHRMLDRAVRLGVRFRPHFKTHQSRVLGRVFRDAGVDRITVASVEMAQYFAEDGWNDITIAFPCTWREAADLAALPEACSLRIAVESADTVADIGATLRRETGVFLKVDTGYGRTGIAWDDHEAADATVRAIERTPALRFDGVLTHAGMTYAAPGPDEAAAVHRLSARRLNSLADRYRGTYPNLVSSVGDTPGCSLTTSAEGADEWRPGNFIFYDVMQFRLGACAVDDIAVALRCTVAAVHRGRGTMVLHGGAVHLSKENLMVDGRPCHGLPVPLDGPRWGMPLEGARVIALSQEHAVVEAPAAVLDRVRPGDRIAVLPVHSCLTADLMRGYLCTDGATADHRNGMPWRAPDPAPSSPLKAAPIASGDSTQ